MLAWDWLKGVNALVVTVTMQRRPATELEKKRGSARARVGTQRGEYEPRVAGHSDVGSFY